MAKSTEQFREALIEDTYALAFGASIPEALMEVSDILFKAGWIKSS